MRLKHWRSLALRFMGQRRLRSALVVAGIGLSAVLLTAVLTLSETLNAGVQKQIREEFGTYNVMLTERTFGPMAPDVVEELAAMPQLRWQVPLYHHEVNDIRTPFNSYIGIGPLPPGESALFIADGRYPEAGEVTLTKATADRLGVTLGEEVTLPFPAGERTLTLVGLVTTIGLPPTAYFDYEWLRSELGVGGPNIILGALSAGSSKAVLAARVMERFPDLGVDGNGDVGPMRQRIEAFGLLGGILAVGALFTSLYLVLGAFGVTVQERVQELAMLRAIGGRRRHVVRLLVTEVAWLGLIGATLGCLAGVGAAWASSSLISRAFEVPAHPLVIPFAAIGVTFCFTLLMAFVGAWPVVRQAGRVAPLAAMRPDPEREAGQRKAGGRFGLVLLAASLVIGALTWLPSLSPPGQFLTGAAAAGLFLLGVLVGLRRILPLATGLSARLLSPWFHVQSLIGRRSIDRQAQRATRMAGMLVVGIAILIALASLTQTEDRGYREMLANWFPTEGRLNAAWGIKVGYDDHFVERLLAIDGVEGVYPAGVEFEAELVGYDLNRISPERRQLANLRKESPAQVDLQYTDLAKLAEVWHYGKVEGGLTGGLVISRRQANDMGIKLGEQLELQPASGAPAMAFPVVGIVENSPGGSAFVIDRQLMGEQVPIHYRQAFIKLRLDADREQVRDEVNLLLADGYAAFSYEEMTEIIEWTKQNTRQSRLMVGLTSLVMLVAAVVGFANIVVASMHERRRELAMVRVVGAKLRQLFQLVSVEAVLLGIASSLLGAATGVAMILLQALPAFRAGAGLPVVPMEVVIPALVAGPVLAIIATMAPVRAHVREPLMIALKAE